MEHWTWRWAWLVPGTLQFTPLLCFVCFSVWRRGSPHRYRMSMSIPLAQWRTTGPSRLCLLAAWKCTPFHLTSRTAASHSAAGFTQVCSQNLCFIVVCKLGKVKLFSRSKQLLHFSFFSQFFLLECFTLHESSWKYDLLICLCLILETIKPP